MGKDKLITWVLLPVVAAGFAFGVLKLWLLRFEAGDVYPPYSSLRSDPLGTKAFCEALGELSGVTVRRNYLPFRKLPRGRGVTLLMLGAGTRWGAGAPDEPEAESLVRFVSTGGRLVICLSPAARAPGASAKLAHLAEAFEFTVAFDARGAPGQADSRSARLADAPDGRLPVPWHTRMYFDNLGDAWRTVYLRGERPVIIHRPYEAGAVVLSADSYYLSNEAMLADRRPELLAWLAGRRTVLFDETHFGLVDEAGIATLARRHGLTGLFVVLGLLAGLFIWKNAVSFIPRDAADVESRSGASVSGRGSAAGLVNLLRKSIPPDRVLSVCLSEWARSSPRHGRRREQVEADLRAVVDAEQAKPPKRQDPVDAYRKLCRILSERKP